MIYQREFTLETGQHGEMRDLTAEVAGIVMQSDVRRGTVRVSSISNATTSRTGAALW